MTGPFKYSSVESELVEIGPAQSVWITTTVKASDEHGRDAYFVHAKAVDDPQGRGSCRLLDIEAFEVASILGHTEEELIRAAALACRHRLTLILRGEAL